MMPASIALPVAATQGEASYRLVTLVADGSATIVARKRPVEPPAAEAPPDRWGDLIVAEALEERGRLDEAETKYKSALDSTDPAVRGRAALGFHRVLQGELVRKWTARWPWLIGGVLLISLIWLVRRLHSWLPTSRRRMILSLYTPGDSLGQKTFGLQVQRQESLLRELLGERVYFPGVGQLLLAPKDTLDLGSLPTLKIWNVDVKDFLVWLSAFWKYVMQRRLIVSTGELTGRVLVRASIESGWRTQVEWNQEADTHEDAAWELVTWVAGIEATRV